MADQSGLVNRRTTCAGLLGGLLASCTSLSLPAAPLSATGKKPNIIWIISDDQAFDDFGFMGNERVYTPRMDALAARSALYPNGYVPTSLCRASLATLITGKYAFQHGICFNDPPEGIPQSATLSLLEAQRPIPLLLRDAGYRSLQTGKFWEGNFANGGFTDGMTRGGRHGDRGLVIGRTTMEPVIEFLDDESEDPFFIWFAPYLPHEPFNAPDRFKQLYAGMDLHPKTLEYYANIAWLDETIGTLMDELAQRGLLEDTLIMFVVDNGWAPLIGRTSFRDLEGRNLRFDPKSKSSPYEDGVRTPFMVSWPGTIPAARHENLVSSIDFLPTSLAAAGLPRPNNLPGISLLDHAAGNADLPGRSVFGDIYYHTSRDLDDVNINLTHHWARSGDWKLIVNIHEDSALELYNLALDPDEVRNLADDPAHAETVATLLSQIERWWSPQSRQASANAIDLKKTKAAQPSYNHASAA